jgi:hypothetical protein
MRMPEERLDSAQIRARVEQMRGKAVTELVRAEVGRKPGLKPEFFEQEPNPSPGEPFPAFVQKQRAVVDVCGLSVSLDRKHGLGPYRADALLCPFPQNTHSFRNRINVAHIECQKFRQTHP